MEFKVGQKVRRIKPSAFGNGYGEYNKIYTIKELVYNDSEFYSFKLIELNTIPLPTAFEIVDFNYHLDIINKAIKGAKNV